MRLRVGRWERVLRSGFGWVCGLDEDGMRMMMIFGLSRISTKRIFGPQTTPAHPQALITTIPIPIQPQSIFRFNFKPFQDHFQSTTTPHHFSTPAIRAPAPPNISFNTYPSTINCRLFNSKPPRYVIGSFSIITLGSLVMTLCSQMPSLNNCPIRMKVV